MGEKIPNLSIQAPAGEGMKMLRQGLRDLAKPAPSIAAFKAGQQCGKTVLTLGRTLGTMRPYMTDEQAARCRTLWEETFPGVDTSAEREPYYWEEDPDKVPNGPTLTAERGTTIDTCPVCQRTMLMPPGRDRCRLCNTQQLIDQLDCKSFGDITKEKERLRKWQGMEQSREDAYEAEKGKAKRRGARK